MRKIDFFFWIYFRYKEKLTLVEKNNVEVLSELDELREEMAEMSTDMKSCKEKEAKLLEFTERLTETNVSLQVSLEKVQFVISRDNSYGYSINIYAIFTLDNCRL